MVRHARLEVGDAVDLARDQHAPVEQDRRHPALHEGETLALEGAPGQGRYDERRRGGRGETARGEGVGVQYEREVVAAEPAHEAREAAGVVAVTVAQDDRRERRGVDVEATSVRRHALG